MDEVVSGRYRLLSVIGVGKVYKAHDTLIGRDGAVTVLPLLVSAEPGYQERFRREAHIAARLTEPHRVPIYDTGEIGARLYRVMPAIDGIDVQGLLKRDGRMTAQRVVPDPHLPCVTIRSSRARSGSGVGALTAPVISTSPPPGSLEGVGGVG